ncbi:geranylgeranylglyceryl/heptaprenylglyceryl phosphate synthase [bacterium]|nr:geranylgeranylglyceryl/heptaprenylglyceryl phosphate synthase [FCB group bacterium]MBL7191421.1 geranylgeranylglyceryl/heptaprenylglyceryl phosphate synthase [bacterium]
MKIYNRLIDWKSRNHKGLFVLIDPDKGGISDLVSRAVVSQDSGADLILVGGSHLTIDKFDSLITAVKDEVSVPVVLFPGGAGQLSGKADAVLLLSLISGRNPQYLIGEHVTAAPIIKRMGIEAIPTGYMLIESGKMSAIEFITGTKPIPRDQIKIAVSHAIAGELLGMKLIYLEAGSGGANPVPVEMITAVSKSIEIPLIAGGGIRSAEQAQNAVQAGADFIVVGNALEDASAGTLVREMKAAINPLHPFNSL